MASGLPLPWRGRGGGGGTEEIGEGERGRLREGVPPCIPSLFGVSGLGCARLRMLVGGDLCARLLGGGSALDGDEGGSLLGGGSVGTKGGPVVRGDGLPGGVASPRAWAWVWVP